MRLIKQNILLKHGYLGTLAILFSALSLPLLGGEKDRIYLQGQVLTSAASQVTIEDSKVFVEVESQSFGEVVVEFKGESGENLGSEFFSGGRGPASVKKSLDRRVRVVVIRAL